MAITNDGGRTWTSRVVPGYGTGTLNTITCPTEQECFAAGSLYTSGNVTQVLASTDGGQRWSAQTLTGPIVDIGDVACWDELNCLGVGDISSGGRLVGGALMATNDGGSHWSSHASPVMSNLGGLACPAPRRCVLVGSTGLTVPNFKPVARYTTDGATWHDADLSGLPLVSVATISCGSADLCVAVGQGQGSIGTPEQGILAGVILESSTAGANWTSRPLPDNVGQLHMVACAPSGFCVAGATHLPTPMWRLLLRRPNH